MPTMYIVASDRNKVDRFPAAGVTLGPGDNRISADDLQQLLDTTRGHEDGFEARMDRGEYRVKRA